MIRGPGSAAGRPSPSPGRGGGLAGSPGCSMLTTSEERLWGGGVSARSGPGSGQRPPPLARRPRPLANCAAQRPPASVRLPLHLRRVRPADGARAVRLRGQGEMTGVSRGLAAPVARGARPCTAPPGGTFNHLSTHLAWNSWLQGRTRRSCRASKSLKHTTHLGEGGRSQSQAPLTPHETPTPPAPPGSLTGSARTGGSRG